MTWQERVDGIKFKIFTGDGKVYFPLYKGGVKSKEYNTSMFDFIEVYGTLVTRKKPRSPFFELVFWFQGENNIELADEFEKSADDPRTWTVIHPFYGEIVGQPISIKRDDSWLNITEITVPFWESIEADYPFVNFSVKDNTRDKHQSLLSISALSAVTGVTFTPTDISKMSASISELSGDMKAIQDGNTYSEFQNALNSGLKAIDNLLETPLDAIQNIQNFVDLPALYEMAVENRVQVFESMFARLKRSISTLADKKYFESIGGTIIGSMSVSLVNPQEGDYVLVSDVVGMTNRLATMYKDYVDTLDEQKVSIYDVNNTYNQDAEVQKELGSLVSYTVSNLYLLSFETKRERIIYTDKNTNPILLVHKYLGMDDDDANLDEFIKTNNLKLEELFNIEKGREIRYAK